MLNLTELVYLAAPFATAEERAFNDRLSSLMRDYNFPLFMPEELSDSLANGVNPFPECAPELGEATPMQTLSAIRMDLLNRANLVVAVYHGNEFDPATGFEVGYAIGRRTNVVAVRSPLKDGKDMKTPEQLGSADNCMARLATPNLCSRVVFAPYDDESFPDRLIPILNRYFVPHKL